METLQEKRAKPHVTSEGTGNCKVAQEFNCCQTQNNLDIALPKNH